MINSDKNNKILINVHSNKSIGSLELFIPKELSNITNIINPIENMDTPNGDKLERMPSNNSQEEIKYQNILNLKESIDLSKEIFDNYFNTSISHLNELIKRSDSEQVIIKYIDDLMKKENNNEKILKLIRYLKKLLSLKFGLSFESIVLTACELFQEIFQFSIEDILYKYPEDYIELGKHKKFWLGKRCPPKVILLDINNEEHFQILYLFVYFLCQVLNLKNFEHKMNEIKLIAKKYEMKTNNFSVHKRANDEKYFEIEKTSVVQFLKIYGKKNKFEFKELKLNIDNNDDINDINKMNKHLKFIILTSNLILKNYGIKPDNNIYKLISLLFKIDNVLPSTASSIAGIILIQLLLMFNDTDFVDFFSSFEENKNEIQDNIIIKKNENSSIFQNACFNLASNIFLFYNNIKNKKK